VRPDCLDHYPLKDAALRHGLCDRFHLKSLAMEASASWDAEIGYVVVRGICDYRDKQKDDRRHCYATRAAAAYTRALLA
jgi:nucleoside phosphorylase